MRMPTCQMHLLALSSGLNVRNVGEQPNDRPSCLGVSNISKEHS